MKYSVIIPVFNTADYLPRCMDSLLCQRTDGWEVILVDDQGEVLVDDEDNYLAGLILRG